MIEKIHGMVLEVHRHNDRCNVVSLYTRSRGRVPFLVQAGGSRQARLRQSRLMPMAVIECDVNFRENKELQLLGAFQPVQVPRTLYFDPVKAPVMMFVAEFTSALVRTSPPDPPMWDFIAGSLRVFDSAVKGTANFHLALLVSLLSFSGIQPDLSTYAPGRWFDMEAGVFTPTPPLHRCRLHPDEARWVPLLSRMDMANFDRFDFTRQQRRRTADVLLDYYALHLPGLGSLKSPSVLSELFG